MTFTGLENLRGQAVFVTGATGFIGARLVPVLLGNRGYGHHPAAQPPRRTTAGKDGGQRGGRNTWATQEAIEAALRGQSILFHLAYDVRNTAEKQFGGFRHASQRG